VLNQNNICQFLPVGLPEGNNLLEKSQHAGQACMFDSSGSDNSVKHAWNFSVPGILGIIGLRFAFKLIESIFSNFCEFLASQGSVTCLD
jgi:hypothetical protein